MRKNRNGKIYMTYDQWEELHKQQQRNHKCDNERRRYFESQKLVGVLFIAVSLVICFVCSDISGLLVSSMVALIGVVMMLTNKMVIVNDYWREHGGAEQWDD